MNMAKRLKIGGFIVSLVALATFLVAGAAVQAEDNETYQEQHSIVENASSIENASQIAGYTAAVPKWIPAGFVQGSITVPQLRMVTKGPETRPIEIEWVTEDGSWIHMVQLPGIHSFPKGESIQVAGVTCTKISHEAACGRPPLVSLYWQDGDRSFSLSGTMTKSLGQEALLDVVASIDY